MEAHYWLALYALDPDNEGADLDTAATELNEYLAASGPRDHVAEAMSLSRVAVALRSLTRETNAAVNRARASGAAAAAANGHATDVSADRPDSTSSSDAEVRRLREQLAKANAELERIRKRLTNGGKPPAP
jgi:signal transduction protein with GAF and PtsI domain